MESANTIEAFANRFLHHGLIADTFLLRDGASALEVGNGDADGDSARGAFFCLLDKGLQYRRVGGFCFCAAGTLQCAVAESSFKLPLGIAAAFGGRIPGASSVSERKAGSLVDLRAIHFPLGCVHRVCGHRAKEFLPNRKNHDKKAASCGSSEELPAPFACYGSSRHDYVRQMHCLLHFLRRYAMAKELTDICGIPVEPFVNPAARSRIYPNCIYKIIQWRLVLFIGRLRLHVGQDSAYRCA